jgi:hypothetical protein
MPDIQMQVPILEVELDVSLETTNNKTVYNDFPVAKAQFNSLAVLTLKLSIIISDLF